ncbi:MAG: class I SAM-dependent methyltransferase [Candidatus Hydrogenedentes bacterium]|jgi:SAM-dependent methyltransferase|nr:class I SAM-dependent methyltransferase [Candidatus Hydrogenedentota bacterium]
MTDTPKQAALDPEELKEYSINVWKFKQGEVVSLMIHIGDRLGLYKALDGAGPITATELAGRTELQERWLLEWLKNQAAAGILEYSEGERFELSPVGSAVLAHEDTSLAFAAGAFSSAAQPETVDKLVDAFRTGIGLSYQDLGPCAAHRTERMLGPWTRLALVPKIIPALDGVSEKLESGALAADVGCGAGVALLAMAEAYPDSEFHGYDLSAHAIERAAANAAAREITNARFHVVRGESLPTESAYDFMITFDCIHDMTRPAEVIAAIRKALKPDGVWLIKDIRSKPRFEDNFRNPLLAMMYGFSVSACMSSALSEPGGAGLGTLGFNPEVAEKMVREAGFTRFSMLDFDDPGNLYYDVRQ